MLIHNKQTKNTSRVKFIEYTGKYPCLCMGVLILEIDGVKYTFGNKEGTDFRAFWISGGYITDNYSTVIREEWRIDVEELPEQFRDLAPDIDMLFNENVDFGCCGGCI